MTNQSIGTLGGLLLCGLLGGGAAQAAEPCPWAGTEHSVVCDQWTAMSQRLEAAQTRARNAEQALQSLQGALQTMEQSLKALGAETPSIPEVGTTTAVPDAEEQRVRGIIDGTLDQIDQYLGSQPAELLLNRDYTLEQQDGTYVATFPEAALSVADQMRIDFGPLRVSVDPLDDDRAGISLRLADILRIREGDKTQAELAVGSQTLTGVWSNKLRNFSEAKLDLLQLQLTIADNPGTATLGHLSADQSLTVAADDSWRQQQNFALADLLLDFDGNRLTLAGVDGQGNTAGNHYSRLRNLSQEIQQISEQSMDTDVPPVELFGKLAEMLGSMDGYQFTVEGRGLQFEQGGQSMGQLGRLAMGADLTREDSGARVGFFTEVSGVTSPLAPLPPDITPDQARLEVTLANIPPQLFERLVQVAEGSKDMSDAEQEAYWQQQLLGMLMSSGLELRISDTYVAAPEARADLNLRAGVDPQAVMGGTGELLLRIVGMQKLIDATGGQQDEGSPVASGLSMLTAFSNRIEEDGKMVDVFDLKFTQDGKLMLNNKDVTAMFMPGAGDMPEPPAE